MICSLDYNVINKSDISNINKYFMVKKTNNIFGFLKKCLLGY